LPKNIKLKVYKSIMLPMVLYGGEIWSPTLREGHRLRLYQNRVLRRTAGMRRDESDRRLEKTA
jgi:hypothetical protein